jgi:hypothetical protein
VRARDELDDREPEPGAVAAARLVAAAEAIERSRAELLREALSLVQHVELDGVAGGNGAQLHVALSVD